MSCSAGPLGASANAWPRCCGPARSAPRRCIVTGCHATARRRPRAASNDRPRNDACTSATRPSPTGHRSPGWRAVTAATRQSRYSTAPMSRRRPTGSARRYGTGSSPERDSTRPTSCSAPERAAAAGASRSFRPARPWTGCTRTRWLGGCAWRTRSPACSSPSAPTWTRPTPGITRTSNRSATAWHATPAASPPRRGPGAPAGPELPFLAADAKGEDVYFRGAEAHLARRVLVTGYHGDQMWSKRPRAPSADIVRGDQSGLSLSEYRLWAGFIHLPVPFLGVRQIGDVSALSRSAAMAPWDVPGAYSRPICRRIVETAGVPRDAFGVRKQTASVLFFERGDVLSPGSLAEYGEWPRGHAADWSERGLAAPTRSPGAAARPRAALAWLASPRLRNALGLAHGSRLFPHLFPWAVERAKARYRATPYEVIAERHLRAPEQRARA